MWENILARFGRLTSFWALRWELSENCRGVQPSQINRNRFSINLSNWSNCKKGNLSIKKSKPNYVFINLQKNPHSMANQARNFLGENRENTNSKTDVGNFFHFWTIGRMKCERLDEKFGPKFWSPSLGAEPNIHYVSTRIILKQIVEVGVLNMQKNEILVAFKTSRRAYAVENIWKADNTVRSISQTATVRDDFLTFTCY